MTKPAGYVIETARQVAENNLFPTAAATDASDLVPIDNLDLLAAKGFYGLGGPAHAGGIEADPSTVFDVIEILASGCLTTTFVWTQHLGAVRAVASSTSKELGERWQEPLCTGRSRSGVALGAVAAGQVRIRARPAEGGWLFSGTAPFVTGWGRIDVIHTSAFDQAGNVIWALVDAQENGRLRAERLRLMAVDASSTVRARFDDLFVPAERVTSVVPAERWESIGPGAVRTHAALGLGVTRRCCRLLGPGPLDDELEECRARLRDLTPEDIPQARSAVCDLAYRAAAGLFVSEGSRAVVAGGHPERLAREALFLLVFGSRPAIKSALLDRLLPAMTRIPEAR